MNNVTTPMILIGAGIIFIFFGIIGYIILPKMGIGPRLTKWARICLGVTGIILLIIGLHIQINIYIQPAPTVTPTLTPTPTPKPPIAVFFYTPLEPKVGDEITFDASQSYDPDGEIEEYEWDFGDGSRAKGVLVRHSYSESGTFTVKLTIFDNNGKKNESIQTINISTKKIVNVPDAFFPSGWMGDWGDITLDDACTDNPHSEPTCIKITYSAAKSQGKGWAGIYWQYPDSNWGDNPDGRDLTGATKLTFWARGEKGGEKAEFKVGGIDGKYPDSIQPPVSTGVIVLSDKWQQYTIDLTGKDLSHVIGGFCWVTNKNQNPYGCTIYLDDIKFEW